MLSRVANAIYWCGRYLERADNTARFIDVNLQMSLDAPIAFSDQWEPLVAITGDRQPFYERYDEATRDNVLQFLTHDQENPSSIVSCLSAARENARSTREVMSSDVWEQINRFYLTVSNRGTHLRSSREAFTFYSEVKLLGNLVAGVADNTMSHDEAWHFFRLGKMIERADNTTRLLDVKYFLLLPSIEGVGGAVDEMQWTMVLGSASALEMYRKRFGQVAPMNVVDFLLLDPDFPRSVLFCLVHADDSLRDITGSPPGAYRNRAEQWLGLLKAEMAYASVADIIGSGLHEFLDGLQGKLNKVGFAVGEAFFNMHDIQPVVVPGGQPEGVVRRDVLSGHQSQRGVGGYR
jgi:uncharacterized alpha-E superfamily protein